MDLDGDRRPLRVGPDAGESLGPLKGVKGELEPVEISVPGSGAGMASWSVVPVA